MADQPAASATAIADKGTDSATVETFQDYKRMKSAPSDQAHPSTEEKAAPESDPEDQTQEKPKGLTDAEKSARKAKNEERRERRWYQERGEMRAELKALQAKLAQIENGGTKAEPAQTRTAGKPVFQEFLNSGKFDTYEKALEAYQDARDDWNRQGWERERSQETTKAEHRKLIAEFNKAGKEFAKTHEDYPDVADAVQEEMERLGLDGSEFSDALIRLENPHEVINYFGENPDELGKIAEMNPRMRTVRLGKIAASLEKTAKSPEKETTLNLPKPPRNVRAGGDAPDRMTAMKNAADNNDFRSFRKALHAK